MRKPCFFTDKAAHKTGACPECGAGPSQACRQEEAAAPPTAAPPPDPWPCHAKPQAEWCDRDGPGGFMGHTCAAPVKPVFPFCTPREFIEELLFQIRQDAAAAVAVRKDARITELLDANNREVEFRRHGFTAAAALASYLDNALKVLARLGYTHDPAAILVDPKRRHPFADFELAHIAALTTYARAPYGPNPLKESKP